MDYINVQVGKMPGILKGVVVSSGATVREAIEAAEIAIENGYEIRMNNEVADLDMEVSNGAIIVLAKMVKGN